MTPVRLRRGMSPSYPGMWASDPFHLAPGFSRACHSDPSLVPFNKTLIEHFLCIRDYAVANTRIGLRPVFVFQGLTFYEENIQTNRSLQDKVVTVSECKPSSVMEKREKACLQASRQTFQMRGKEQRDKRRAKRRVCPRKTACFLDVAEDCAGKMRLHGEQGLSAGPCVPRWELKMDFSV